MSVTFDLDIETPLSLAAVREHLGTDPVVKLASTAGGTECTAVGLNVVTVVDLRTSAPEVGVLTRIGFTPTIRVWAQIDPDMDGPSYLAVQRWSR